MAYDVIIIGLGAIGSAALYHLTRRGARVVGIERFAPGHERGSSHGRTRIIRLGYFEHPSYVPLVRAAYPLWRDLETAYGRQLLHVTGIVEIGAPESTLVAGTLRSSRQHDLAHEVIQAKEIMRRYPAFELPGDFVGVLQPEGGFLDAEGAVDAHISLAVSAGAEVRTGERVLAIAPRGADVRITTDQREIDAGAAIVAAGAWVTTILPDLPLTLRPTRQALFWLNPRDPALFSMPRFPVFMLESDLGIHYGFPWDEGHGLKVAKHHHADEEVDIETYDRTVSSADERLVREGIRRFLPSADGEVLAAKTCIYTMTPDGDFVLDRLPGAPQIIVASPCSGHGFKFSPSIGEALADLALRGETAHDLSRFRMSRFAA